MPEAKELDNIISECTKSGKSKRESDFYHDRWFNMIKRAIKSFVTGQCNKDLLVLTGPRRVGKTTILLALHNEFKNKSCYINVEDSNVTKYIETHSLKDLIISLHKQTKRDIFFVDEVTSLGPKWSSAVKELWDYLEKCDLKMFIVITGSAGILISSKYSEIAGRSEHCKSGKHSLTNPLIVLPKKFSEYLPDILFKDVSQSSSYSKPIIPLNVEERLRTFINLIKAEQSTIEEVNKSLKTINVISSKGQRLSLLAYMKSFFDNFLLRGGFPQLMDARLSLENPFQDVYNIANEILESVHKDSKLLNLDDTLTKEFLQAYTDVAKMSALVDINKLEIKLKSRRNIKNSRPDLVSKLISFFEHAHIFVRASPINVEQGLQKESETKFNLTKLFLLDPAIFWALYHDEIDLDKYKTDRQYSNTINGFLLEHIICSHMIRLGKGIQLEFYNDGDIDIDCIFKLKGNKVFLQIGLSESEVKKDLRKSADVISKIKNSDKSDFKNYYPVSVVYDLNEVKVYDLSDNLKGVAVPAPYFLSLI